MKKLMLTTVCALAMILSSCGSDDDGGPDCITQTNNVAAAAETFVGNPTSTQACNDYRAVLQSFLDSGCAPDQATEDSIRQQLDTLGDCSVL